MGSSLIGNLAEYLKASGGACGVPFDLTIEGIPGLGLSGLQPLLDSNLRQDGQGFVVIHVGANDIGKKNWSEDKWQKELKCILAYIGAMYPKYKPVWSDMLPRNKWRHGPSDVKDKKKKMKIQENCRKRLQRRARQIFGEHCGTIVHHPSLQYNYDLLDIDGVHLTQQGQADFWGDFLNLLHNI